MPSDAPLVLGFDTSAAHCAAALLSGETVVVSRREDMARGQAERLMPLLEEVLAQGGVCWSDLDAIGVGIGPGNFTGIRISVAAARGLALGLRIPVIGVSALEAQALDLAGMCLSVVPAPRNRYYSQHISQRPISTPVLTVLEDIPLPNPKAEACVVGLDAEDSAAATGCAPVKAKYPLAEAIARIALRRKDNVDRPPPAPLYVRAADAAPASDPPPVILDDA